MWAAGTAQRRGKEGYVGGRQGAKTSVGGGARRTSVGEGGHDGLAQAERRWRCGVGGREVSRRGQQEQNVLVWAEDDEGWG